MLVDNINVFKVDADLNANSLKVLIPQEESTLNLFPNPASNMIKIQLKGELENTPVVFGIFSTSGTQVKTIYGSINQQIDITDLTKGVYILKTMTPRKVFEGKKFIKK